MNTAWLMREIVFTMISGNPHIKTESKPTSKDQIIELSIDKKEKVKKKPISKKEVEKIHKRLIDKINGNPK